MALKDQADVESWLDSHEVFARKFVEGYLHSHPLFVKEVVQSEMEKKQQLLTPMCNTPLSAINPLRPKKSLKHIHSAPNISHRKSTIHLRQLNKHDMFMELLKDVVSPNFDVNSLSHKILVNVLLLTNADRSSLFLVEGSPENSILVSRLFDVTEVSTMESVVHDETDAIKIPMGVGIVGQVAMTGETINLQDAYKDSRFNTKIDSLTGYRTKAILCMPVKTSEGQVIGVAQVINKKDGKDCFTKEDEEVFKTYLTFCAIGLINVQLFDQSFALSQQLQVLLQLAKGLFEEATSLQEMMRRVLSEAQELIPCQKCVVLLLDDDSTQDNILFNIAFQIDMTSNGDRLEKVSPSVLEDLNIAIKVAKNGKCINMSNADDELIQVDEKITSVLCMPIFNRENEVIGVLKLNDKLNGMPFNENEQEILQVFSTFCGLGIHNVINYEKVLKANAKQMVALEVLSYHANASKEDAMKLMSYELPTTVSISLNTFEFDDLPLSEDETVLASVRMFVDLGFVNTFHMEIQSLFRWVMSVKKNYRPVIYHNWRHAFNVAQSMYTMITTGLMGQKLSQIEQLALLIGCFCHDLDHRGTNNAFQTKTNSPLAKLYSTSVMEHHHFDHCIMILNSEGNNILKRLSPEQYEKLIHTLENAILSTDLALYFKKKSQFAELVHNHQFNWDDESHRDILRGMMMTACDVAAITKPWPIQFRTANLVASEFFEQGDRERNDLSLEPMAMMDRKKKDDLPKMQVGFIDAICISLYQVLAELQDGLTPLFDGCVANRASWQELANNPDSCQVCVPQTPIITSTVISDRTIPPPIEAWKSNDRITSKRKSRRCTIC